MEWLSLFPGASRDRPRFMALAEAILRQAKDLAALIAQMQAGFSFARAEGIQLDQIAEAIGLNRRDIGADVPDETFRQYLLAKLALWTWDGTNKTVPEVLGIALPGSTQTDNGDGTVSITGLFPTELEKSFPIPAGIGRIHNS